MSRCFPFPPPGYEKKPTTDEPDLLKKEKRKEKKHKKDKKDKDKKDGKDKREKDRSEGKHKDKKDKKDKHRDKKKDKEKGKSSAPDEKKVQGQFEGYNEEKFHHTDEQNKEKSSFSSDRKPFLQFQSGEYNEQLQKKEESRKEKSSSSDDKKSSMLFRGENGELVRNRIKGDTENSKFVEELDRRIKNEEKGTGSHQFFVEGRKNSFNKVEVQKTDGRQAIVDEARFGRNATIQNKINGTTPPPLDNKIDRRIEQKERVQEKESDDKRGDKRKNKDRDKQRQGKDRDSEKEKKEDKSKEKSEKKADRNKNKHSKKNDSIASIDKLFAYPLENSFQGAGNEVNLKKRKDIEINGVSHENELRPNKMARHISNMSPENGRKIDSPQNTGSSLLDKQGASQGASQNSFKVGSKGQRVNGMTASPPVSVSAKKPPMSSFNHVPSKATPIKSPPVITNHVAAQSSPIHTIVPTTKPQPNHIAAQQVTPKPPPSIPNPIPAQPQPFSSTHHPSTMAKQPLPLPKPPPVVNKVSPLTVVNKVAPQPSLPIPKKKPPAISEPSMKPPHPDTKYLNQILTVPKLEQWCGFDDQEWLFSGKAGPSSKKATMEELQVQVWSEAKHIESVDVCALPYVIPY